MLPQKTVQVKTHLKTALVDALRSTFAVHPDTLLRDVKVNTEFSFEEVDYPAVVVGYRGRDVTNAGVGHVEWVYNQVDGTAQSHKRRHYHGDVDFTIYALSTLDRDIISDALVEIIGLSEVTNYTNYFLARIYSPVEWLGVTSEVSAEELGTNYNWHHININTDQMYDIGDSQTPAPWMPEDVLLYQGGFRLDVFGEIVSLPSDAFYTIIQQVLSYPYTKGVDPIPQGTVDPAPWILGS